MRILFQGAGAISIASAALFTDRHEVAVATRASIPRPQAAYPRRIGWLDPGQARSAGPQWRSGTDRGRRESLASIPEVATADGLPKANGPGTGWTVSDVASTRRVTVTGWDTLLDDDRHEATTRSRMRVRWDLVVLTTRPGDLDGAVASAINELAPTFIATTSQVEGDLDRTRELFPGAEVVVFGPAFLSERLDPGEDGRSEDRRSEDGRSEDLRSAEGLDGAAATTGREVRYWAPAGAPRFLLAGKLGSLAGGPGAAVRRLSRALGSLVLPVPLPALIRTPAVFIPFVAELSIRDGSWAELKSHLRRPSAAASEAVRAATGLCAPRSTPLARVIIEAVERIVPLDVTEYAGRHFARHKGQTLAMLEGWERQLAERAASGDRPATAALALGSLVRALAVKRRSGTERIRPLRCGPADG
ncbi:MULTISPECIES: hypothetical protein [unclassified Brevibacterium]|uniref:hypothetical protein n=1 Tax=unclassified Brevibacterium TaxID=2614124 RepID=UPI001E432ED0|nr:MULTISPECIES: hypothetical protein [unclassified Brevibacterium]MCD1285364.1 hypothetical protein [Brevibacterium sp. CCUG 69071]MDK8434413.1 hypothetical protein [Brevibacterium sp. H-BE7]